MTLQDTIKVIEKVAESQPAINQIIQNDIYRLNALNNAKYATFSWIQREHSEDVDSGIRRYSFYFYYVDRLVHNKSNEVDIQSTGVEVLSNICKTLRDDYGFQIDPLRFSSFNHKFIDECAGVYCSVDMTTTAETTCGETY